MQTDDEQYDTIETPAAWLTVCAWVASAYHWFRRIVWCRRNKHAWVEDPASAVFLQSRWAQEFLYLAECKHCDSCRWVRLRGFESRVVDQYATYDEAQMAIRTIRADSWNVQTAYEVHS